MRLRSGDPAVLPEVTQYAFDSDADLEHALEGVEIGRRIAASSALDGSVERELETGAVADGEAIRRRGDGRGGRPGGQGAGFENLVLADASLMPAIPRCGTTGP